MSVGRLGFGISPHSLPDPHSGKPALRNPSTTISACTGFLQGIRCLNVETVNPGESFKQFGNISLRLRHPLKLDVSGDQQPVARVLVGMRAMDCLASSSAFSGWPIKKMSKDPFGGWRSLSPAAITASVSPFRRGHSPSDGSPKCGRARGRSTPGSRASRAPRLLR